jgi:hypothetical protein
MSPPATRHPQRELARRASGGIEVTLSMTRLRRVGGRHGEITPSFARVFELAGLYGTAAPTDWPTGGLTAPAQADTVTGADALKALGAALSNLEGQGVTPGGILGGSALRAALRASMVDTLDSSVRGVSE